MNLPHSMLEVNEPVVSFAIPGRQPQLLCMSSHDRVMQIMKIDLCILVKILLRSGPLWPVVLKTFCLLPIDGTWTLQERDHVIDITVLFVNEHFPDTLWMLISCVKFLWWCLRTALIYGRGTWMEEAVFSMSISQNNHCSFTERDYELQNHEILERLNMPGACSLLWSEP